MNKIIYTLAAIVLLVLIAVSGSFSQTVNNNFTLTASLQSGSVLLSWQAPESFAVSIYRITRFAYIPGAADSIRNLGQIDSTTGTTYEDTAISPYHEDYLSYTIWAVNSSGQKLPSNSVTVHISNSTAPFTAMITSPPVLFGIVNSLYSYQVRVDTSSGAGVIAFRLPIHPDSMTVDSTTGLISWIPRQEGWYTTQVAVFSNNKKVAAQQFQILVSGINGTIAGTVTDGSGTPLSRVIVSLYQGNSGLHLNYDAVTDPSGNYTIRHVAAGNYFASAVPMDGEYLSRWYNDADSIGAATPIVISDTTTQHANFHLQNRFASLPHFTITGFVKDTNGAAITGALVVFANTGFAFNSAREDQSEWQSGNNYQQIFQNMYGNAGSGQSFSLSGSSPFIRTTYTNNSGAYAVDSLLQGPYIAFVKSTGYPTVFYNNQSNFLLAQIIPVNSDTSGINFTIAAYPPLALGGISGTVTDSATGAGLAARIIAYRDIWDYPDTLSVKVPPVYFAETDSTGTYAIGNVPPGHYKILALPLGSYAPTFYSLAGPTERWKSATAVIVNGSAITDINIPALPIPSSASGYTAIGGKVLSGATLKGAGGVLVYAIDSTGNVAGYAVTGTDGSFSILGLAPGTYSVTADVMGFNAGSSQTASPGYASNGNAAHSNVSLSVTPSLDATSIHNTVIQPTYYILYQNYPNPFNPITVISYQLSAISHVTLTIYDILGRKVATLVHGEQNAGMYQVNFDGSKYSSGVYFYRIAAIGNDGQKFMSIKKLVLMK